MGEIFEQLAKMYKIWKYFDDLEYVRKKIKKKKLIFAWSSTYLNDLKHICRQFLLSLWLYFVSFFFFSFCIFVF